MAIQDKRKKRSDTRTFIARDFDGIKNALLDQARIFFPDKIRDFNEASVGGLFLDMAASIGDSLNFYLDHAFRELDPLLAVENESLQMHVRNAGMDVPVASPASVTLDVSITVPAESFEGEYYPRKSALPRVLEGSSFVSNTGITFFTIQDLDFDSRDVEGRLKCKYSVRQTDSSGNPFSFNVTKSVRAISGNVSTEQFSYGTHEPFVIASLNRANVTRILDVLDSELNEYHEVNTLSEDTVFRKVDNIGKDAPDVSHNLELTPAPYRYRHVVRVDDRTSYLQFGAGDSDVFDDDILPDPSDVALELYGGKSFKRFSINPNSLLRTQTLGIAPSNTTITVTYRHGGGSDHNVSSNSINEVQNISIEFRNSPTAADSLSVRQSLRCNNPRPAKGGAEAPGFSGLRAQLLTARNSQNRVVTKEDLLARIYTLPTEFGSVYRAALEPNPSNPLASILYICSTDSEGRISTSPDTLKENLALYLNEYRLVSDAIDILDVSVTNFMIEYEVISAPNSDKIALINSINSQISQVYQRKFFQVGTPIIMDDLVNVIINFRDVVSLSSLRIRPRIGIIDGREYSSFTFSFEENTKMGILHCPKGSIFELRYPGLDIIGSAL